MNRNAAENFVNQLYAHVLGRSPKEQEFEHWVGIAEEKLTPEKIFDLFVNSKEYKSIYKVHTFFPIGHYYSPIVDPELAKKYINRAEMWAISAFPGIKISQNDMLSLWNKFLPFMKSTPFTDDKVEENRFFYMNGSYPYGDAIILRAFINHFRPRQIIEIGSGFSSACMLDAAEHAHLTDVHLTCIEPDADRLRSVLRPKDAKTVTLMERPVQDVPLEVFSRLNPGDFLFIDSTHVLKTGSDVHYELFSILPTLKRGVIIHFHDIQFPFEYPDEWIFERNHSWNEVYALRAFLMYNQSFRVLFLNSLLACKHKSHLEATCPLFLKNPGGGLWIEKTGD